ncbi:TetR/AcrR family transcriptional regulator [Sinosporangium siamense]|uniref:TetR family transcriptional regulator n=1 Tax=Sinosporangium siamense TaxID=1367973 RepID=A0A919RLS2_9ACTN|nr:TetR family transcriptional regulator [Sinosporangium siamense]GII96142.1 TetR family transcriptional regulator [Sinosporangium siamense]
MPPTNPARRRALADAAIDLLAASGIHGLTHRAVEKAAGLPTGTASNYYRSREALLVAAAERVVELHYADMDRVADLHETAASRAADGPRLVVDLLTESLFEAATTLRTRYLAIFELQLESTRRPTLAAALAGLLDTSALHTAGYHTRLGLRTPAESIPTLIILYAGALFTLVTLPPQHITRETVRDLARSIVHGGLPAPDGPA